MIKKVMIAAVALVMSAGLMAQSVQETVVNVGAMTVPAFSITLEKDVKLVDGAMKARLKEANLKTKNSEGYVAVLEQVFEELATVPVSLYTKVEEQGKKKNKVAVVTVCATSTDLTIDQNTLKDNLRAFLTAFPKYVDRYEAKLNMEEQQEQLKKAQKVAASAASAVTSIEKSIASSENKIADKQKEIEKLKGKIKDCEKEISDLEKSIEKDKSKKADAEKRAAEAEEAVKAVEQEVERFRQMAQ